MAGIERSIDDNAFAVVQSGRRFTGGRFLATTAFHHLERTYRIHKPFHFCWIGRKHVIGTIGGLVVGEMPLDDLAPIATAQRLATGFNVWSE